MYRSTLCCFILGGRALDEHMQCDAGLVCGGKRAKKRMNVGICHAMMK
jgi:hypothetical protein